MELHLPRTTCARRAVSLRRGRIRRGCVGQRRRVGRKLASAHVLPVTLVTAAVVIAFVVLAPTLATLPLRGLAVALLIEGGLGTTRAEATSATKAAPSEATATTSARATAETATAATVAAATGASRAAAETTAATAEATATLTGAAGAATEAAATAAITAAAAAAVAALTRTTAEAAAALTGAAAIAAAALTGAAAIAAAATAVPAALTGATAAVDGRPTATVTAEAARTTRRAAATAEPTATAAAFTGPGDVDLEGASLHHLVVERLDGRLGLSFVGHLHEAEATRTTGLTVHDEVDGNDLTAVCGEDRLEVVLGDAVGEVPHVDVAGHSARFSLKLG